jgi:hypothetical protein
MELMALVVLAVVCLSRGQNNFKESGKSELHHQRDARWIVIRGQLGVIMIRPSGGQPRRLAARRAYLVD